MRTVQPFRTMSFPQHAPGGLPQACSKAKAMMRHQVTRNPDQHTAQGEVTKMASPTTEKTGHIEGKEGHAESQPKILEPTTNAGVVSDDDDDDGDNDAAAADRKLLSAEHSVAYATLKGLLEGPPDAGKGFQLDSVARAHISANLKLLGQRVMHIGVLEDLGRYPARCFEK